MDFELSPAEAAAREMALDFARKEIAPRWRRREAEGASFPRNSAEMMLNVPMSRMRGHQHDRTT